MMTQNKRKKIIKCFPSTTTFLHLLKPPNIFTSTISILLLPGGSE